MYSYDSESGMYRMVSYTDADGTKHFYDNDSGRTVEQMRNAKFNDTWTGN
jgi:hypothetical protein